VKKLVAQVRGTSGSGKTWVIQQVMAALGYWEPVYCPPRRRPLYYLSELDVAVLGAYETPCGGCDGVGSAQKVYDLIRSMATDCYPKAILAEGLLLSEDVKWTSQLRDFDLRVIFLATPLEVCLRQVELRRRQSRNEKSLNPKNTANRVRTIERARSRLQAQGVFCPLAYPDQAVRIILGWLSARKLR
jgi:hypothetical protein